MWVAHDVRDQIVDFVRRWSEATEIGAVRFIEWLAIRASKFYDWRDRYGRGERTQRMGSPGLLAGAVGEKGHHRFSSEESAGRLPASDVHDAGSDIVAVSPSSVWRVLGQAGLLSKWKGKPSKKGTGFEQPLEAHGHWHIDVSYINISGTFYYLCSVLDGYSRFIVHWDLRESMTETDIEIILERAKEQYPRSQAADHFRQRAAVYRQDFKEFIRISGMTHVRTSPYYPQSNGKLERWHKSLKSECIRPGTPLTPGGCTAADPAVRGSLQSSAAAQRHSGM